MIELTNQVGYMRSLMKVCYCLSQNARKDILNLSSLVRIERHCMTFTCNAGMVRTSIPPTHKKQNKNKLKAIM
jgi:hypothetical protein